MARRTGAWRLTPLTARSTRGVRASLVTSRAVEQHRLPAALLVGLRPLDRDRHLLRQPAKCLAVVGRDATLQRRQRQRPIHEPGIHEGGVDSLRQLVPDGALAGARRPVDGHRQRPIPVPRPRSPLTRRSGRLANQPSHLGRGERPPLPEAQAANAERSQADADQPQDPQPNGREEAPHLALAPLADPHAQPIAGLAGLARHFPGRRGGAGGEQARRPVFQRDAVQQRHQLLGPRDTLQQHGVLALHRIAGMQQAIRPRAVVGEHHQPLGIDVQPSGGPQAGAGGDLGPIQEAHHAPPAPLVLRRRDVAARLVHGDVDGFLRLPDGSAIHRDGIGLGVGRLAERCHLAVDRHPPVADQRLGAAARGQPGSRERLLEALSRHPPARPTPPRRRRLPARSAPSGRRPRW